MSTYLFPFAFSAIAYLILGLWVVARQNSQVQKLYGFLCITTCLWQATWTILFAFPGAEWLDLALKVCFSGVVLIPSIFYHFINKFVGEKNHKKWILATYALSA